MIGMIRGVALGAFALLAAHASDAFALSLGPQPTDLKPGLAVNYYFGDFSHIDRLVEYAEDSKPLVGEPWETLNARGGSGKKVRGTRHKNNVGAVISGYIRFPEAGGYTLDVRSNDGVRLTIGGQMLHQDPEPHPDRDSDPIPVQITEPGWYPIEVVWYERKGSYIVRLRWSQGGEMVVVPAEHLAH